MPGSWAAANAPVPPTANAAISAAPLSADPDAATARKTPYSSPQGKKGVAAPLTSRLGLFAGGGAGENGWGMGELGVRTWMSGTGAPGTLILSASLGYSAIFDGPSRDFVGGPAVGFGMEWRL